MNYAILIGCNTYPNASKELRTLRCAENDAKELKKILLDPSRGNFGKKNITLFTNEPHHEILDSIYRYLDKAMSNDIVLIYYSGHGWLGKNLGLHLCTSNTNLDSLPTTSLPMSQIKQWMDQSLSIKIVCILDCCYSGNVSKEFKGGSIGAELQRYTEGKGKYIITASDRYQLAKEIKGEPHSVFTKYMLEGLKGAADLINKGMVTQEDIYTYAYEQVSQKHNQKVLRFVTAGAGDFVLVGVPPDKPSVESANPYVLGEKNLSFIDFPDILKETRDEGGKINIAFVVGSGRCRVADHASFGTDALFIPEVIGSLKDWDRNINVSSYLDIDIFGKEDITEKNLIIIGSGKVNLLTMELLTYFYRALRVRFAHHDVGDIISECGVGDVDEPRWYYAELPNTVSNEGLLTLMRNPWADEKGNKRIIILAGGSHPIGTIAAQYALNDYIKNREKRENNRYDEHIPAKVVKGQRVEDKEYIKRYPELQATPKNTPTYIGNIKYYDTLE